MASTDDWLMWGINLGTAWVGHLISIMKQKNVPTEGLGDVSDEVIHQRLRTDAALRRTLMRVLSHPEFENDPTFVELRERARAAGRAQTAAQNNVFQGSVANVIGQANIESLTQHFGKS